jgi:hypothetical protein
MEPRPSLYGDKIDSAQPVRTDSALGGHAPAYCVVVPTQNSQRGNAPALLQIALKQRSLNPNL